MRTYKTCDNCDKPLFLRVNYMVGTPKGILTFCSKCYHNYIKERTKGEYANKQRQRCLSTCLSPSDMLSVEQAEEIIKINGGIPKNCNSCQMLYSIQKYFEKDNSNSSDEITESK